MKILKTISSKEENTIKYTLSHEGHISEAVYFQSPRRNTASLCLSSQYGCLMGCSFCASEPDTFDGNISCREMLESVSVIEKDISSRNLTLPGTYDLKGIGEPLMNYHNIKEFYKEITKRPSTRHVKISTCGIAPRMRDLASDDLNVDIFLSLHNPFQNERVNIMPISRKYPVDEVIRSCEYYYSQSKRQVVASYLLLEGVNDTKKHLDELVRILDNEVFRIELLLYNNVNKMNYIRLSETKASEISQYLTSHGIQTKLVVSKGRDIEGGCGQLRNTVIESRE